MVQFDAQSEERLKGVDPELVEVLREALSLGVIKFRIAEGVRTLERQRQLVQQGRSKTLNSKHLIQPDGYGHAVDIYPVDVDMQKVNNHSAQEISRFGVLWGVVAAVAKRKGITLRWGGDWDGDGQTLDHTFFDAPHIERVSVNGKRV